MNQLIATIPKNAAEEIRVEITDWKGHDLLNVRVFYGYEEKEKVPTRKGLTFKLELLPEMIRALTTAEAVAVTSGLLASSAEDE